MLYNIIQSGFGDITLEFIDQISIAIELLAVLFIVISVFGTLLRFIYQYFKHIPVEDRYLEFRHGLGRALLLGLEMLIAADIIRTVALEATIESVVVLGLLVIIRTFLSWSLVVEIEGHWPWQAEKEA